MLLDAGSEIDATDSEGRTPLHLVAGGLGHHRRNVVRFLRFRGAPLDARDARGRRPADVVVEGLRTTAALRRLLEGRTA